MPKKRIMDGDIVVGPTDKNLKGVAEDHEKEPNVQNSSAEAAMQPCR